MKASQCKRCTIHLFECFQSKQAYESISVPKMYHPFICGAHNEKVTALMNETGVRINIPPLSVQKDEITIAGEKEGVMAAKEHILSIHQEMVSLLCEPWKKIIKYLVLNDVFLCVNNVLVHFNNVFLCGYNCILS